MILTGIYIFSLPRTWKSDTILLPESSANSVSGNLGSIAAIAGIKMNTGSTEDAIYPEFYPKVLGSTIFLTELLKQEITVSRLHKKVSIFEYFENCQIKPWWSKLFNSKKEIINSNVNPTHISKQQQTIVDALFGSFFAVWIRKQI